MLGKAIDHEYNLADLLRRPGVTYANLMGMDGGRFNVNADLLGPASSPAPAESEAALRAAVEEQVEIGIKYAGYIDRQKNEVRTRRPLREPALPTELDYMQVAA